MNTIQQKAAKSMLVVLKLFDFSNQYWALGIWHLLIINFY